MVCCVIESKFIKTTTKYEHLILYHWQTCHNKIIKDRKYEKEFLEYNVADFFKKDLDKSADYILDYDLSFHYLQILQHYIFPYLKF